MTAFDILAWCCLVFAGALFLLGVPGAFYFAARAERRRKEHAEPDLLDAVDTILTASAELAPRDVKRRYGDLDVR
jgi:hypothetical protein